MSLIAIYFSTGFGDCIALKIAGSAKTSQLLRFLIVCQKHLPRSMPHSNAY